MTPRPNDDGKEKCAECFRNRDTTEYHIGTQTRGWAPDEPEPEDLESAHAEQSDLAKAYLYGWTEAKFQLRSWGGPDSKQAQRIVGQIRETLHGPASTWGGVCRTYYQGFSAALRDAYGED